MSEKHRNFYHYHSNFASAGDSNEDASNRGVHEIPIPGGISDLLFGNIMKVSGSDWKHETAFDEEVMYETTFRFYKTRLSKINTLLFTKSIDAGTLSCEASVTKTDATESSSVKPKSNLIHVSTSATTDEVTLKSTKTERLEQIVRSLINGKGQSSSVHSAKPQKQLKPNIRGGTIRIQQERVPSFFHLDQKLSESGLDFSLNPERSSPQSETEVQCDDEEHSLVSVAETFIVQKSSDSPVETISSEDQTGKNFPEYRSDVCSYEFALDNVPFEVQDDEFASHVQDQQCRLQSDICTSHTDEIDPILRESCQSESQSEKLCSESQIVCEGHITNGRTEIGPTAKHVSGSQSKEHLSGSLTEVSLPCASTEDDLDSEAEKLHPDDITSKEPLVDYPIQEQDVSMKEQCYLGSTGEKGPSDVSTKVCLSDFSNEDYCSNVLNVEHISDAPAVEHVLGSHAEECLSDFPGETFCEERSSFDLNNQSLLHASEKGSLSGSHSEKHFPEATTNDHRPQSPDGELILNNSNYQNNSENQTKSTAPDFQLKEVTQTQIERLEVKILGNETFTSETEMPRDLSQALVEISDTEIEGGSPKVQTELLKAHSFSSGNEGQECQLQITKVQNEECISETQTKSSLSELGFEEFPTDIPNVAEVPPETSTSETCQSAKAQAEETLLEVPCETSIFQAAESTEAQVKESLSKVPCECSVSKVGQYSESQVDQSSDPQAIQSLSEIRSETSVSQAGQTSEAQSEEYVSEVPCETSIFQPAQFSEAQAEENLSEVPCEPSVSQAGQYSESQVEESLLETPCETSVSQVAQSSDAQVRVSYLELPCEISKSQDAQSTEDHAKASFLKDPSGTSVSEATQSSEAQAKRSLLETPCEISKSQAGQSPEPQAEESPFELSRETSVSQAAPSFEGQTKESLSEIPCETSIAQSAQSSAAQDKASPSKVPCEPLITQAWQYSETQAKESHFEAPCETSVSQVDQPSDFQVKESLSELPRETLVSQTGQSPEVQTKESLLETPCETSMSQSAHSSEAQAKESLSKVPCESSISQVGQYFESQVVSQVDQFSDAQDIQSRSELPRETSISEAGQTSEAQTKECLSEVQCLTSTSQDGQSSEAQTKKHLLEIPCETSISHAGRSCESQAEENLSELPRETSVSQVGQYSEAQTKESLSEVLCETLISQSSEAQAKESLSTVPCEPSISQAEQYSECQAKVSVLEAPCETSVSQVGQSSDAQIKVSSLEFSCEISKSQGAQSTETQNKESLLQNSCGISISQAGKSSEAQAEELLSEVSCETSISQSAQSTIVQAKESLSEHPCEPSLSPGTNDSTAHPNGIKERIPDDPERKSCLEETEMFSKLISASEAVSTKQTKESLSEVPCETLISQSSEAQAKESLSTVPCEPSISQAEQYSECQAKVSVLEAPCETSVSQVGQSSDAQIKVSSLEFSCEISKSQGAQSTETQNKESLLQNSCGISISQAGKSSEAQAEELLSEVSCETSISQSAQSTIVQAKESLSEHPCEPSLSPGTNDSTAHPNGIKERIPDDPERKSCLEETEKFSKLISASEAVSTKQLAFEEYWRTLVLNTDCPEMTDKGHSTGGQVNVSSLVKASHELSKLTSLEAESSSRQTMSSKESTDPWNDSEDSDEEDAPGNLWEVHHSGTETLAYCAGDKIDELEPFVYVLREDMITSRCSYCFESVDSSTKTVCSNCYYAVYCDMNCQDRHLETHIRECSWLRRVHGTKFPDIYIRLTALVLSKLKDRSSHNISYSFIDKTYCYEDLPPDIDTIPKDILKPRGKRFWDILYYQFQSFVNDSSIRFDEFRKAYYKVSRNSMFISTNPYDEIGRGVYFGMAGIHTSCYPNSNVSYTGTTAHIVATCDIDFADRERITIRPSFDMGPRADRQAAIKLLIWKLCDCKLCQSDEFEAAVTKVKDGEKSSAIMNSVENILKQMGDKNNYRYDEEELKIASLCLKSVDRVAGPYHHARLTIMPIFAGCLAKLGRYEEAISAFKKLLRIYRHVYGPNNYYTLNTLQNMVFIYQEMCRRRKARKYSAKVVQTAYFIYGYEHPIFKHIRYNFILSEKSSYVNEQS